LTYDLATGKRVGITEFVTDTTAVVKMLEQAFRKDKQVGEKENIADHLLIPQMMLPINAGLVQEGIRFYYNPYEIAAYALGPTDVILTWEQLGALADRKKWIKE
jgi:Protein of unknown function (DUF3298)